MRKPIIGILKVGILLATWEENPVHSGLTKNGDLLVYINQKLDLGVQMVSSKLGLFPSFVSSFFRDDFIQVISS